MAPRTNAWKRPSIIEDASGIDKEDFHSEEERNSKFENRSARSDDSFLELRFSSFEFRFPLLPSLAFAQTRNVGHVMPSVPGI